MAGASQVEVESIGLDVVAARAVGRDVGVDGGGARAVVAEQDLDGPQVGAGLEQVGGEAVPQGVDGDVLLQARRPAGPGDRPSSQPAAEIGPSGSRPGNSQVCGRAAFQ